MTSLARHHTRWCLIATATVLVVAFALHDVSAQFRPPGRPPGGNFSGNPGAGFAGVQGGFAGNPGAGFSGISGNGFTGMPNNFSGVAGVSGVSGVAGVSGVSGISGFSGGIGGDRFEYFCSRCNTKVSQFATRCPNCGAIFTGTTFMPGSGPNAGGGGVLGNPGGSAPPFNGGGTPPAFPGGNNTGQPGGGFPPMTPNPGTSPQPGGGFPPQNNPGTNPPQGNPGTNPPADNKPPADTPKTEPPSTSSSSSGSKSSSNEDKDSGLSAKVIVGASIAALGVFALIAGLVVVMNSGGAPAKKSRPRRFRDDDYD